MRDRLAICRHRLPCWVAVFVQLGPEGQAAFRPRMADEVHDHLVACQRASAPIVRDVTKHSVFDFVPLARPGRKVANGDPEAGIVGKLLQLPFPQAVAAAVRAAAIGCDQQTPRSGMASHLAPPPAQCLDSECRRVMVDADAHPSRVVRQIVNTVRKSLPKHLVGKIMHVDGFGLSLTLPLLAIILIFSNKFLLFRVNRHDRLTQFLKSLHTPVDIPELRVPVRVLIALERFAVGLQTVARIVEHPVHRALADLMAGRPKLLRQMRGTAACPAQWTGRVAARTDLPLKSGQKPCAVSGFLPPPGLRNRSGSSSGNRSSSLIPAWMVVLDIPVASATRAMPPRPIARASTAAQRRRVRSSSKGLSATNLACTTCVTACSMTWNITHPHNQTTILFWRKSLLPSSATLPLLDALHPAAATPRPAAGGSLRAAKPPARLSFRSKNPVSPTP